MQKRPAGQTDVAPAMNGWIEVFDHVAVFVGKECLFHKPDPTLSNRYQINHWDKVVGISEAVDGFELTFQRKLK